MEHLPETAHFERPHVVDEDVLENEVMDCILQSLWMESIATNQYQTDTTNTTTFECMRFDAELARSPQTVLHNLSHLFSKETAWGICIAMNDYVDCREYDCCVVDEMNDLEFNILAVKPNRMNSM